MNPACYDIYWAHFPYGHSNDLRPCMIYEVLANGNYTVIPISSALDLFDRRDHFMLHKNHPDFPATGLRKESFLGVSRIRELRGDKLAKRLGVVTGQLLQDFKIWFGAP